MTDFTSEARRIVAGLCVTWNDAEIDLVEDALCAAFLAGQERMRERARLVCDDRARQCIGFGYQRDAGMILSLAEAVRALAPEDE